MKSRFTIKTTRFEKSVGIVTVLLVAVLISVTYVALRQWRTNGGYTQTVVVISLPAKPEIAVDFCPLPGRDNNLITRVYIGYWQKDGCRHKCEFQLNFHKKPGAKIFGAACSAQDGKKLQLECLSHAAAGADKPGMSNCPYEAGTFIPCSETVFADGTGTRQAPGGCPIRYMPGECFTFELSVPSDSPALCIVVEISGDYDPDDFIRMWTALVSREPGATISWCRYMVIPGNMRSGGDDEE